MAQVNVVINNRQYRMACEDGEEDHLVSLAADFDQRIARLRKNFGEIGDTRLTVMAALTLSDELSDMAARVAKLEAELGGLRDARAASGEHVKATQSAIVAALNSAAERIEGLTRRLNQIAVEGGAAIG
jgi:cell division protein ZapA